MFLPEQLVLHIDEYTKQKQENNTFEVKEAQKWGLSVEEYRAQNKMLLKRNEEKNKDHDNRPILPDNQEEHLAVGGKPDDSFPPMGPGDSVRQILGEDKIRLQTEEYERIQREQKRKHSLEDYEVIEGGAWMNEVEDSYIVVPPSSSISTQLRDHNRPNEGEDQPVSLPSHTVYQNIPRYSGTPPLPKNPDSSHSSYHSQHRHGNSDQGQVHQHHVSQHQDSNLDQISSGLAVGSMVQMTSRGGAPIQGVIQWIGIVPDYEGYVAGVELVSNDVQNNSDIV